MPWFSVCDVKEIPEGSFKTFTLLGKKVAVFLRKGELYAISVMCRHQGADLSRGARQGDIFTCPRHHWQYNLYTGECLSNASLSLPKYPVRVKDARIEVELGGQIYD
ncbi:Rieske (2Fe-2S) protein [Myxococcota bacterium]|nr:Rieske (2Fe-2S) protein [Myxococcota bacterium]MBU1533809.1 Rieske (2Fe-2S) protein [Myxococcota bacterium]